MKSSVDEQCYTPKRNLNRVTHSTTLNGLIQVLFVFVFVSFFGEVIRTGLPMCWQTRPFHIKGALDKYNIIPQLFSKKVEIFIPLEVLAWVMTECWVLHSKLTYFWRNMNVSIIFYFPKSTSINTQYSSLWDTLKMMLFTKYLIKWKCIGRIGWKFQCRFDLKSSIELDIKR